MRDRRAFGVARLKKVHALDEMRAKCSTKRQGAGKANSAPRLNRLLEYIQELRDGSLSKVRRKQRRLTSPQLRTSRNGCKTRFTTRFNCRKTSRTDHSSHMTCRQLQSCRRCNNKHIKMSYQIKARGSLEWMQPNLACKIWPVRPQPVI